MRWKILPPRRQDAKFAKVLFLILAVFSSLLTLAFTKEESAKASFANRPVKFLENLGQMMDMENNPVPFVLFKAEAPGMNMYITEKGLTYMFIKAEEEAHPDLPTGR